MDKAILATVLWAIGWFVAVTLAGKVLLLRNAGKISWKKWTVLNTIIFGTRGTITFVLVWILVGSAYTSYKNNEVEQQAQVEDEVPPTIVLIPLKLTPIPTLTHVQPVVISPPVCVPAQQGDN